MGFAGVDTEGAVADLDRRRLYLPQPLNRAGAFIRGFRPCPCPQSLQSNILQSCLATYSNSIIDPLQHPEQKPQPPVRTFRPGCLQTSPSDPRSASPSGAKIQYGNLCQCAGPTAVGMLPITIFPSACIMGENPVGDAG